MVVPLEVELLTPLSPSEYSIKVVSRCYHLGRVFIVRIWWVICRNYTQIKVLFWTAFPLWGGMWTRRSLWNIRRSQNVWFWRFTLWRVNGSRKGYIWRGFKFATYESRKKLYRTDSEDRGAIGGRSGKILKWSSSKQSIDPWRFIRNNKYIKKWIRSLYSLTLLPHVMKICIITW